MASETADRAAAGARAIDGELGLAALVAVDRMLADEPDKVGHDFAAAEHAVARYRDALAAEWRRSGSAADRTRLAGINAVLSVVLGGHFPLGGVPWQHLRQARDRLAELVG